MTFIMQVSDILVIRHSFVRFFLLTYLPFLGENKNEKNHDIDIMTICSWVHSFKRLWHTVNRSPPL